MDDMRILIIDDEEIILSVLNDFFSDMGVCVSSAVSGMKGLELIGTEDYDAVIVDMRMPDISGNELIEKALEINDKPVYFIHTGAVDYELTDKLRSRGLTDDNIIFKPIVDLNGLFEHIRKITGK